MQKPGHQYRVYLSSTIRVLSTCTFTYMYLWYTLVCRFSVLSVHTRKICRDPGQYTSGLRCRCHDACTKHGSTAPPHWHCPTACMRCARTPSSQRTGHSGGARVAQCGVAVPCTATGGLGAAVELGAGRAAAAGVGAAAGPLPRTQLWLRELRGWGGRGAQCQRARVLARRTAHLSISLPGLQRDTCRAVCLTAFTMSRRPQHHATTRRHGRSRG